MSGRRVWAVATAHFDTLRPGDRVQVDPEDPYVVENQLFEGGYLELESEREAAKAAGAKEKDAGGEEGERDESETALEPST